MVYFRYGEDNRYKKWKFRIPPVFTGDVTGTKINPWFKGTEISGEVRYWFHQKFTWWDELHEYEYPFYAKATKETYKKVGSSALKWPQMSTYQPVEASAWKLKEGVEEKIDDKPSIVLQDNAWEIDEDVGFRLTFTGMNEPENFLRKAHRSAEMVAPLAIPEGGKVYKMDPSNENAIKSFSFPGPSPVGLAYGDNCLWGVGQGFENRERDDEKIFQMDPSDESVINSFNSPTSSPVDLAWDGKHLWIADDLGNIYKVSPNLRAVVKSFDLPVSDPSCLTHDGKTLWIVERVLKISIK